MQEKDTSFQTQIISRSDAFKFFVCKTFEIVFVDDIQNMFIKMLHLFFCHLTI
jgi:hypothetical protein